MKKLSTLVLLTFFFSMHSAKAGSADQITEQAVIKKTLKSYQARSEDMRDLPMLKRVSERRVTLQDGSTFISFEFTNVARGDFLVNGHQLTFHSGDSAKELDQKILAALPTKKSALNLRSLLISAAYAESVDGRDQRLSRGVSYIVQTTTDFFRELSSPKSKGLACHAVEADSPRCFTANFWCQMDKFGEIGTSCNCKSAKGPVNGKVEGDCDANTRKVLLDQAKLRYESTIMPKTSQTGKSAQ